MLQLVGEFETTLLCSVLGTKGFSLMTRDTTTTNERPSAFVLLVYRETHLGDSAASKVSLGTDMRLLQDGLLDRDFSYKEIRFYLVCDRSIPVENE